MTTVAEINPRDQMNESAPAPTRTLMVYGLWGRRGQFSWLQRVLESRVGPTEVIDYDSSGSIPFETLGAQLADEIRRRDEPVNIVGFSMGGLVARTAYMLDPTLRIGRAVFIHSPHRGSLLAHALPRKGIRQMRPSSEFLRAIGAAQWNIPTLALWSPLDTMVVPGISARWPRATQTLCVPMPVHIWPLYSGRIHRQIAQFLRQGESIR